MDQSNISTRRAAADDPRRCQAVTATGQCNLTAVEGGTYCIIHGGVGQVNRQKREATKNYRLTQWRARVADFSESSDVKSVREEIGILRLLMEETINRCATTTDLLLQSALISDLVSRIERTVSTCHKLESQMGQLMDKQAILRFASRVSEGLTALFAQLVDEGAITPDLSNMLIDRIAGTLITEAGSVDQGA